MNEEVYAVVTYGFSRFHRPKVYESKYEAIKSARTLVARGSISCVRVLACPDRVSALTAGIHTLRSGERVVWQG